jgi:hypothetical protein
MRLLFNKYLDLCNYKQNTDVPLDILQVEFEAFTEPTIEYKDIPEITHSKFKQLMKNKTRAPLTEMENSQVEKFLFQNYIISTPEELEIGMWKIYTNFGRGKFRNLSYEKGITEGNISIKDIMETSGYSHLTNGWCLRLEVIKKIHKWIGLNNTQEYGQKLTKDKLNQNVSLFQKNRKEIHVAFDLRDRTKGKLNPKSCLALINKVFDRWGFSRIKMGKRKKVRVEGKRVDVGEFEIVGSKNDEIDIYKFIKPKNNTKKEESLHPLLRTRRDRKVITDEELEKIRLNPSF